MENVVRAERVCDSDLSAQSLRLLSASGSGLPEDAVARQGALAPGARFGDPGRVLG